MRERTQNFLLYGFLLSIALHLMLGPFIKFQRAVDQPEKVETVRVDRMPTPPPTPKPTPPPTPTPPPVHTPPPRSTPQPPKPQRIKINTLKSTAHNGEQSEEANTHTTGSVNGAPEGTATGAATAVAVATPVPPTPPPPPTPTPLSCANPNVPARTTNAVQAETPAMAQQQGVSGEVTVLVTLDENSKLVGTPTVQKSASALLNGAAIQAAAHSSYATQIVNCKPVGATYRFIVEFQSQ